MLLINSLAGNNMKPFILISFLLMISNVSAESTLTASQIFAQAVQKSQSGDCQGAIELFSQLPASVNHYLNVASCYFASEDYLSALLFVKKAEKIAGPIARVRTLRALKLVQMALGQPLPEPQTWRQHISYALHLSCYLLRGINPLWLELLLLGLWVLLLLAFKAGERFKMYFIGITSLAPIFLLLLINNMPQEALVSAQQAKLYSGPGNEFLVICNLSPASLVRIVASDKIDGFYKIKQGSCSGWVKENEISLI
jgi:hypothetical protein